MRGGDGAGTAAQPLKCSGSWTCGDFQLSSPGSALQPFSTDCWIIDRNWRFMFLKINTGLYIQTHISDTKRSELSWCFRQIYDLSWIVGIFFFLPRWFSVTNPRKRQHSNGVISGVTRSPSPRPSLPEFPPSALWYLKFP